MSVQKFCTKYNFDNIFKIAMKYLKIFLFVVRKLSVGSPTTVIWLEGCDLNC